MMNQDTHAIYELHTELLFELLYRELVSYFQHTTTSTKRIPLKLLLTISVHVQNNLKTELRYITKATKMILWFIYKTHTKVFA